MRDLLEVITNDNAIIVTAPPGWGKTYKLLQGIKDTKRKSLFLFPLRALCDEVYLSALKFELNVCNIRKRLDLPIIIEGCFDLIITTPECLNDEAIEFLAKDYVFIFDEAHLLFYWGESFRPSLIEVMEQICSFSPPSLFLSATMSDSITEKIVHSLEYNFEKIYHVNFGNQQLKNIPGKIYLYPQKHFSWMMDDILYSKNEGVKLVFCPYRKQVKVLEKQFLEYGLQVLSCVGGEAADFIQKLNTTDKLDVIVATSVVSHGVNLPAIKKIYFLSKVENIDFYLQMIGRGGRDGSSFELHTLNTDYFNKGSMIKGYISPFLKRIGNKVNSFLY